MLSNDVFLLRRLSTYIKPHRKLLFFAALFLLGGIVFNLARPFILKYAIDKAFLRKDASLVGEYAFLYFITIIMSMVSLFIQNYTLQTFGQRVIYEIRNTVFRKLISRSPDDFKKLPIGNLVTRVTNDIESLRTLYTDVILKLISSSLMIIGILVSMYMLSVKLALVVSGLLPVMAYVIFAYQKFARKAFRGVRSKMAASNATVQEILNFIIIIKTYVGQKKIEKQYDKVSRDFLEAGLYEVKTFAIFRPIVDVLLFVAIICVFTFTNWFDSVTDAGVVFAFLQYIDKFFQPIKDIADKYNSLQSALAGAERLVPILNEKEYTDIERAEVPAELRQIESIVFDHVWFTYPDSTEPVLKDISFSVTHGEFLGIVGPSGGGKSTLMSLLMGFYRPTKGTIYINGQDMSQYPARVVREIVGYVFQDSHLFKGTIRENLAFYDAQASEETIMAAARKAYLHDMISRLPQGYDTPVGYLGSLLSSGQKQLLALARTLVRDKKILIFDEATANIDSHTEARIQESIEAIRGEKTIFSIAHRLSTIKRAQQILVIEGGEIVERGSFVDLINANGRFATLWNSQDRTEKIL